jgi:hypothetical protein
MFISYSLLRWYSCCCVNRCGSEHLDTSHGLKVLCRARMFEVHVLPILSYRPSLYCLMSPLLFSLLILILACLACMFLQRPSLNNFLSPLQSSWSVLSLLVFLVSAHARLLTVFCCHRCPLRRSLCLYVLPILSNHLSLYCLLSPHLSLRCFHVLPVPSHRPSL